MKKVVLLASLSVLIGATAFAADFQRSARGGGLGFSYFVLADDPSGALYNPSALGYIKGWQTQLMYEKINNYDYKVVDEKPYYGYFGLVYYKPNLGSFALNSIQSGSFADLTSIPTTNHIVLSYGRQIDKQLCVGASAKYLYETGFGKRSAFDMDLAFSYRTKIGLAGSLALENITRASLSPDYKGIQEKLPRRARLGAGYFITRRDFQTALLLAGQIEESGISQKYSTSLVNVASEWWFFQNKPFSLGARAGMTFGKAVQYDTKNDYSDPTAGISFNYKLGLNNIRLDYAWQAYPFKTTDGSTPGNHYVALTFGWGGVPLYPSRPRNMVQKHIEPKVETEAEKPMIFKTPSKIEDEAPLKDKDTDFKAANYLQYNVEMDVSDISSMDLKRIVFYVRPQQVIKTISWKLYVFKAKIKTWSEEETNRWALRVLEGKGVPPINIVWDGNDKSGELVPKGKYYYVLTAVDLKGQNYATEWFNFKLE
jgi:hypothetical protein